MMMDEPSPDMPYGGWYVRRTRVAGARWRRAYKAWFWSRRIVITIWGLMPWRTINEVLTAERLLQSKRRHDLVRTVYGLQPREEGR